MASTLLQNPNRLDQAQLKSAQHDAQREFFLARKIASGQLSAADKNELEQIAGRKQARQDDRRREFEAQFAHLPPLPPALPTCEDTTFGPLQMTFFSRCMDGKMDAVEEYVEAEGDQVSDALLQRGLASACEGGSAQVARYLMQKGAQVHDVAVEYACRRCDLALFEVFIEHGWHPNQQVPSIQGHFGVALSYVRTQLYLHYTTFPLLWLTVFVTA